MTPVGGKKRPLINEGVTTKTISLFWNSPRVTRRPQLIGNVFAGEAKPTKLPSIIWV